MGRASGIEQLDRSEIGVKSALERVPRPGSPMPFRGSPWENCFVESFHNRLRDECLNQEIFLSVTEACVVIEEWRRTYNRIHPHSRLGFQSPDEFARRATRPGRICATATPPLRSASGQAT